MTVFEKPDIINILREESIELKQRGKYHWALCPFHAEKTPSFKVNPDMQQFYCWGCHEHGDVLSFIQKYKGLSFNAALSYLGIGKTRKIKPDSGEIRKNELIREYQAWLNSYTSFLCNVLRRLDLAKIKAKAMREVEAMAFHYHSEPIWEHHLEILLGKDEETKFELYKGFRYGN